MPEVVSEVVFVWFGVVSCKKIQAKSIPQLGE
jgi:hypothetical protein